MCDSAGIERAYIGLGANLGNAAATLQAALDALAKEPQISLIARSSIYRSAPIGFADQPDFFNAVAAIDTTLDPQALLATLQRVEHEFGRVRSFKNAPRTLDVDLLLYGAREVQQPQLRIPHPRMHERAFVLVPLAEIAPETWIPGQGPIRPLLDRVRQQKIVRLD